jgi:prepilin-type processing-associated H-X9-DG protein
VEHNYPVTEGDPPVARGRYPGTFQTAPRPTRGDCNPGLAQSPHPGGMTVAMADGSVRLLQRDMAANVYWALVTPAGGEVFSDN